MTGAVFIRLFARQVGLTLAALCLMLQAAVPTGFMLAGSDGVFPLSIVICGAQGQTVSAADLGLGHEAPAPEGSRQVQHCAFPGFGGGMIAPEPPRAAPSIVAWTAAAFPVPAFRGPTTRTAASPPPSRGPPSFV